MIHDRFAPFRAKKAGTFGPKMEILGSITIKKGREKKIRNNYPWVQKEEVAAVMGRPSDGGVTRLLDFQGSFLAVGIYNSRSRFPFRVLSLEDEPITESFFSNKIQQAVELRSRVVTGTDSRRVLFAEADGLPGLIADQYGDQLIVQVRNLGMEKLKPLWLQPLIEATKSKSVFEKSDMAGRAEEGLEPTVGELHGRLSDRIVIEESGLKFVVPVLDGLKTGFYLDQRDARRELEREIHPGEKVADLFCYTGGFSLYAARAGAEVVGVDIHERAIEVAKENAQMNGLGANFVLANAFEWLEAEVGDLYDRIILDPPAIAKTRGEKNSLKWAIWKLVFLSIPVLKPGGRLLVCNCSYQLSLTDTIETIRLAASDRGRRAFLEKVTFQAPDHPALIQFPESLYLKSVWVRIE